VTVRTFQANGNTANFDRSTNKLEIRKNRTKLVRNVPSPREAARVTAHFLECEESDVCKSFGVAESVPSHHLRDRLEAVEADTGEDDRIEVVDALAKASSYSLGELVELSAEKMPGSVKSAGSNGRVGKLEVDLGGIVDLVVRLNYVDQDTDTVTDDAVHVDVQARLDLPFVSPVSILDVRETMPVGEWLDKIDAFDLLD